MEQCDGSTFMDRMIRVDVVNKKGGETGKQTTQARGTIDGDPKLCVFVGNLDFASKEEDLRIFFEGLVSAERGPPGEEDSQEDTKKPKTWVTRVRIVRDKETQLGKGFAYIQFAVSHFSCSNVSAFISRVLLRTANASMKFWQWKKLS